MTAVMMDKPPKGVDDSGEYRLCPAWVDWMIDLFPADDDFDTVDWEDPWSGIPYRIKIVIQIAQTLVHYNMAYAFHDPELQVEVQQLMMRHLQRLTRELMTSKPSPDPWNFRGRLDLWPWSLVRRLKPGPQPWRRALDPWPWKLFRLLKPGPDPWVAGKDLTRSSQLSLEIFRALALYKMAFESTDVQTREQVQSAVGRQLESLVTQFADLHNGAQLASTLK